MEEQEPMNTPAFGVSPLGVTIARKQLQGEDLLGKQHQISTKKTPQQRQERHSRSGKKKHMITTTTTTTTKRRPENKKKKNASWMALVEGVTLYGLCLIVPSLLGVMLRLDQEQLLELWEDAQIFLCQHSSWLCWNLLGRVWPFPPEPEPLTFDNFASDTSLSDVYIIGLMTFSMALCRVWLVHMLVPNNLAPQQMEALVRCKSIHLLSSEYKKTLTPRETPRSVITWESIHKTELTSTTTGSSSSQGGGAASSSPVLPSLPRLDHVVTKHTAPLVESPTSELRHRREQQQQHGNNYHTITRNSEALAFQRVSSNDGCLSMDAPVRNNNNNNNNNMGGFLGSCGPKDTDCDSDNRPLVDDSEWYLMEDEIPQTTVPLTPNTVNTPLPSMLLLQQRSSHNGSPEPNDHQDEAEDENNFSWKRAGSTASLAAAAAAAVQEEEDDPSHMDSMDTHDPPPAAQKEDPVVSPPTSPGVVRRKPQRLFAAPRYATAVFRLLYCALSCTMALYLFRDADFWPSYVGGHGSTARCWDLSGSLALAKNLDADFDHRNTVLRRFFLVQASYHLHSGAFHVFSVVLLFFLKKEDDDGGPSGKKRNKDWVSLLRSLIHPRALLQHSLSLFFLSVSYVFSSLRRLGAIGMFALDMSSLALHLLQTCLNAPTDSILSQKRVIRGVWALLVVPSFLYFRFYVWPMVGYSARVESEHWLSQLESTLVPGCAVWFRWTFQTWMALWMGFHAIHFKRLFFHPHIQRIMAAGSEEENSGLKEAPSL